MTFLEQFERALTQLQRDLLPLVQAMSVPCRVLGAIGALFYISYRIWRDWADAAPIDVFGLLRPFVLILCISFFPIVITFINGILDPITHATEGMYKEEKTKNKALNIAKSKAAEEYAKVNTIGTKDPINQPEIDLSWIERGWVWLIYLVLDILKHAVFFFFGFLRTVALIILATIGPLAFSIAVWPGTEGGLSNWITKYLSISLWLPIIHITSFCIERINGVIFQTDMLEGFGTIMMAITINIIAILSYICAPIIAGWIVQSGGGDSFRRGIGQGASLAGKIGKHGIKGGIRAKSMGSSLALKGLQKLASKKS